MKPDHVSVVEAAYSVAADDAGWVTTLASVCQPLLDEGLGVGAWTYDASGAGAIRLLHRAVVGGPEDLVNRMDAWSREIEPMLLRRLYPTGSVGCLLASRQIGWSLLTADAATRKHLHPVGVFDLMGITTPDPDGSGAGVVAFYSRPKTASRRTIEMWGRIGVHLSAAFRLRRSAGSSERHADAILDPNGKLLHAETPAKSAAAREHLREAARSMDRARSATGRLDAENAVAAWRALVAGKWTLVDRFESDGRRFLVARRNDPAVAPRSELTPREAQIAGYAALGHSSKLIAYSLGLSQSVVSESIARVLSKLGISSRAALIRLFAETARAQREKGG